MTKTKKNISTRRKVAAAIAATTIATGTFAPLIAEELDPTPAATATTEAGDTATTSDDTPTNTGGALAPHLTSGDLIYSSEIDAHFRVDNAQAGNDSTYTDLTVTNDSSVASNLTWASLDTLRTFLPEGATFGSPAGKSGEIVKGSDLITNNIAEASQVDPEKDYWFMGKIPASGEVRISVVKKEEPKEEPTPAPETPEPTPAPETPAPDNTGATTPAPETPAPSTDTPVVENTAETIDKNYKAPAETEIPKDNATRHDSAGRVVSTAPVTTINTDAQAGTTTTRFEDGGEVTTNTNTGEVLESTLGTTVTTTGTTINSTPTKKTTPTAKTTNTSNTVKGQTLRTGDAGVATITTAPAAAMPLIATGLSLALAGTLVATNARTNRRKKEN